jgi:hypothetical protein
MFIPNVADPIAIAEAEQINFRLDVLFVIIIFFLSF